MIKLKFHMIKKKLHAPPKFPYPEVESNVSMQSTLSCLLLSALARRAR